MNKATIIDAIAEHSDVSKKMAGEIFNLVFDSIEKGLKQEKKFTVPSFGTFTVKRRAAREGRNPQTGETITIKSRSVVTYKSSTVQKEKFN